ncbi:MAG: transposase, partial [Betaproteobacteria bacterium]|nr:transposase [Betaproteobacteria bacterium]
MEITPIYKRVIGLDVRQNKVSACALIEQSDGTVTVEQREFGGFKRDRRALAEWVRDIAPDVVVMESTGIYWKSPYAALETVGIAAWVVNARHVKTVPGRKTDVADAQWLATLARAGPVRATRAELFEALQPEELSAKHLFVLAEVMAHIEHLETAMS